MTSTIIETTDPQIYIDADGWQPYEAAINLLPIAGTTFIAFGLVNIFQKHHTAGALQIALGMGMIFLGFFIGD